MIEFDAVYFDGRTSARTPVRVCGLEHSLHIVGGDVNTEIALTDVHVDARIGDVRRTLALPGGAQLQTDDHAALAALFPGANRFQSWVHTLEQRWRYALAAIAIIAGFSAWCVVYGLPLAAQAAARAVPVSVEAKLGTQSLFALDTSLCAPSALAAGRQQELQTVFGTLTAGLDDGYRYQVQLRDCRRIGPNAFALPGGTIVVTDELIGLAQNDQQIAAVLAHEVGHVRYRHGLRLALQGAGAAALIAALAGDAVAITGLAVMLPTALLQIGYTRDFESDADTYAFRRMKEIGLSPKYFAEIMMRLEDYHRQRSAAESPGKAAAKNGTRDYLSTHPDTARRIERALADQ